MTFPRVRPASTDDTAYVIDAFETNLAPYYGGDHTAHARRVLETHLGGGEDRRGLLSARQTLYVLWEGEQRKGVMNLVLKRQGTCKISPLILHPESERNRGLGSVMLAAAEQFARDCGARQLYCTVAARNQLALGFFQSYGFVVCGRASGQYKDSEVEVMLRKPIEVPSVSLEQDEVISVTEAKDDTAKREAAILITAASPWQLSEDYLKKGRHLGHDEIDGGGEPLQTWTFCARAKGGRARAAAIAEQKKGGAIKILAIGAEDTAAFRAMVVDLPSLLSNRGRKAFVHLAADPGLVSMLQEAGWAFEAHLPDAYRRGTVTEQWGIMLAGEGSMRTLRIHRRYLDLIESGKKNLEIRVGYDNIKRIHTGDVLRLMSSSDSVVRRVADVRTYKSFVDLLDAEPLERALPGMTRADALAQLREFYPPEKEGLGVYVFELETVESY